MDDIPTGFPFPVKDSSSAYAKSTSLLSREVIFVNFVMVKSLLLDSL